LFGVVIIQPLANGKTRQQRRGQQAAARGRADEREARQRQAHAAGVGALVNNDVQLEILHRRIKIFLDGFLQAVDFVNEQNVALLQIGQQAGQVAGLLDGRAAGAFEAGPHAFGDDVGQGGFAQAGRPAEQQMIQRFAALLAACTAISRRSLTLAWPTNSEKSDGRSVISNAASGLANTSVITSRSAMSVTRGWAKPPARGATRENLRPGRRRARGGFRATAELSRRMIWPFPTQPCLEISRARLAFCSTSRMVSPAGG
jgi:hypothetical protein